MDNNILSLYELNSLIRDVINYSFEDAYWVKAEIARINENSSGHCYLELVEKSGIDDSIIAQCRAIIWRNIYWSLVPYFRSITGKELSVGMKILFKAKVEFHPVYGLSLHIIDIDPNYTLGELVARRMQIITQLKNEGVYDMNRQLPFPLVPQRIAVISSKTAAGYNDFVKQLSDNVGGYKFNLSFYQASMQGNKAEKSIIFALERIFLKIDHYDVVVIIRGGGSQVDLSCFDSYLLASHVAQFPLPVITGIGHEQDESIVDMVAHTALKTPTAVADFLIDCVNKFELSLDSSLDEALNKAMEIIEEQQKYIEKLYQSLPYYLNNLIITNSHQLEMLNLRIKSLSSNILVKENNHLNFVLINIGHVIEKNLDREHLKLSDYLSSVNMATKQYLNRQAEYLNLLNAKAQLFDPAHILKQGYSISLYQGKALKSANSIEVGETFETILFEGKLTGCVLKKNI
jgi:exodeoxyribonuclease VII large subunit